MPKVPRGSIIAMDKSTGLYEVIKPSKANRAKFRKVGAPRYQKYPITFDLSYMQPLTLEQRLEFASYHQQERETLSLLSRLTLESRTLEERLSDPPVSLPLIDRISVTPQPIHIPPPIPKTLKFWKTKLLCRIEELRPNLTSTIIRLQPIVTKLSAEAQKEKLGLPITVSPEIGIRIWDWFQELERLEEKFDTIGHKLTNAQWRKLSGTLKRVGRISFVNLADRFPEICKELDNLNITLP